ncbi:hypothetical protein [Lentilactobacillus kisonensis]|uniref:hypothetical protein n=1 Tax=Lentilactobacillus kisonensis TaxID=481722 RepID=UPI00215CA946|nr:hypothetical protein [Lentilactobacillus kisonensis]
MSDKTVNPLSYLVLVTMVIFLSGIFIRMNAGKFNSPMIARNTRNTKVAVYRFNELTIFPLVMFFQEIGLVVIYPLFRFYKSMGTHTQY